MCQYVRDDNDETDADEGPFGADKSFTGALSTTDFENASLEVSTALLSIP